MGLLNVPSPVFCSQKLWEAHSSTSKRVCVLFPFLELPTECLAVVGLGA